MDHDVVIVGGGPAGMMAGLLFARAGIRTHVLEKHSDFLRDFRGDTVHPSTMELMDELGLLEKFLARPHDRIESLGMRVAGQRVQVADFRYLPVPAKFIAMMPQWEFLDFLRDEAMAYPGFKLSMDAEVTEVTETERVTGVRLKSGQQVLARRLVIIADGRNSIVRSGNLLPLTRFGAPMDVLWFRVPKPVSAENRSGFIFEAGRILVLIDRQDYWQCAFVFPKGAAEQLRARGLPALVAEIEEAAPELGTLGTTLSDWKQLSLLSVSLDRLDRWHRPGMLAIGDAAHAMSPIGGVGINLAIQDAVAAANILAAPLVEGRTVDHLLAGVEKRRLFPTRLVQSFQAAAQASIIGPLLKPGAKLERPPLPLRMLDRLPILRRIPARIVGLGVRREHIRSPIAS